MVRLKGTTWDHPRGYDPLIATSKSFTKLIPNIEIDWKIRSLKDFGDYPAEKLVEEYDLILIDHPFMGEAYNKNLLVPLNEYFSDAFLKIQERESVGKSYESYSYKSNLFALPVDAAALVSVANVEEVEKLALSIPKTIKDIFEFANKLPKDRFIAIPFCPTDIWCLFLTLCAQIGGENFFDTANGIPNEIGEEAMDIIYKFKEISYSYGLSMNPIQVLDQMTEGDAIIYSPFLFGYTNYSRAGWRKKIIKYFNSPIKEKAEVSTILGGVGIAVSANSKHIDEAVEYVKYVTSTEIQKGIYFENGGQPAHLSAWKSEKNNKETNNFFKNTLKTLEKAYMRPRIPKWNVFQEASGGIIHKGVSNNKKSKKIIKEVNRIFHKECL